VIIRRAGPDDLATIVRMRRERLGWLTAIGSDQWSVGLGEDGFAQRVEASIARGETWLATSHDRTPVGTIAVDRWTNPGLWSEHELADALIVHRMITTLAAASQGIGAALLAHADELAVSGGYRWLRLDAWTTNRALHRLYEHYGFRHVRTVAGHRSRSAALFERRASHALPSSVRHRVFGLEGLRDRAGNPIPPDHDHVIAGAVLHRPPLLGAEITSWDVAPGASWSLWWQDGHWRTTPSGWAGRSCDYPRSLDSSTVRVERWPGPPLHRGTEYVVTHTGATAPACAVAAQVTDH
jgi:GNAT superfamily N-acetyltransferase